MKHAREVGRISRDQAQGAFTVERLETIEQLPSYLEIDIHSQPDANQFVHFGGSADRNRIWADPRQGKLWPFPNRQSADVAALKCRVVIDRLNHGRDIAPRFHQKEFTNRAGVIAGCGAGYSNGIATKI